MILSSSQLQGRQRNKSWICEASRSKASLRFEKKQRRRLFIQERKDAAALEAQTQQPDVWYKVRDDGVWEEHRRSAGERRAFHEKKRSRNPLPTHKLLADTGSAFTLHELLSVKMDVRPPPPAEWQLGGEDFLLEAGSSSVQEENPIFLESSHDNAGHNCSSQRKQNDGEQDHVKLLPESERQEVILNIKIPPQPWKSIKRLNEWRRHKRASAVHRLNESI